MKNKFIYSKMDSKNSFYVASTFTLFNTSRSCKFKLDTGCNKTCIPIKKLNVSDRAARILKQRAIDEHVPYVRSYGVSDTQMTKYNDQILMKEGKAIDCTALRFEHRVKDFSIGECLLGDLDVGINYDRTGNILLGMDILKNWDIHIGTIDTGDTIFMACPKDQINDEYLMALENTFHIGTEICRATGNNEQKNIE